MDGTCIGHTLTLTVTALSIGICDCICVMFLLTEGDKGDDDNRTEILFDRLMLMELREIMGKLDPKSYAELRSYNEPPKVMTTSDIISHLLQGLCPKRSNFDRVK